MTDSVLMDLRVGQSYLASPWARLYTWPRILFMMSYKQIFGWLWVLSWPLGLAAQPLQPVPLTQVQITDAFWQPKLAVWRQVTLPDCFNKFEQDGALENFDKVRDGRGGDHGGAPWYDGLIYEMIRASADFLATQPDPQLTTRLDGYIDRIAAAAAVVPDGYLNTYTTMKEPGHRWGANGGNDRWQHDLYNASALVEAGVYYYRATGKTKLLAVASRQANLMAATMGPPPKANLIPGHALGEESLVGLYELYRDQPGLKARMPFPIDEKTYLALAQFWIDNRGHHAGRTNFGAYDQDEIPVADQTTIEGHAVRATLLGSALVANARINRPDYLPVAQRLWDNMVQRKMYVTGGLGAIAGYEGFGPDYLLPNDGYVETCAAVGAGFYHENLNLALGDAKYADELERVLYNGVLPGVSLAGNAYFYENPLTATDKRERWSWNACPCCPPMFLKIMGALPGYIYAQDATGITVNLFIGSHATIQLPGTRVKLVQTTEYPWQGKVQLLVNPEAATDFTLRVRVPAWCAAPQIRINGRRQDSPARVRGYATLTRRWQPGDRVELELPMPIQRIKANPAVTADLGRIALQRGPLVYCVEGVDNGGLTAGLVLPATAKLQTAFKADQLNGVMVIQGQAIPAAAWAGGLYQADERWGTKPTVAFTAIPYFANANRGRTWMQVWLPEAGNP